MSNTICIFLLNVNLNNLGNKFCTLVSLVYYFPQPQLIYILLLSVECIEQKF